MGEILNYKLIFSMYENEERKLCLIIWSDKVKSLWSSWTGLHTCYKGFFNEVHFRNGDRKQISNIIRSAD